MSELISVVTLTYRQIAYTRKCLTSLLKSTYSPWELVVVDNGSNDDTVDWLARFEKDARMAGVKLIRILNPQNKGCSTARNQAIAAARGSRIVFVDNDVALRSRDWLQKLSESMNRDSRTAMVGAKLVFPVKPYNIQFAGGAVSPGGRVQFVGRGERRDDLRFNRRREVQWYVTACLMARRSAILEAGGFDEAFNPVQFEDTDLCYRIRSHGHNIIYEPSVEMYHYESTTTAGTATLPNAELVVRHGLLFKERWKHMFETENGPPEAETAWKKLPQVELNTTVELPLIGE